MSYIKVPKILLPKNIDMSKWATIACDQFTARPKYWEELDAYVGESPSTLRLVFPEIYLNDGKDDQRISKINKTMKEYSDTGLFQEIENFILVEREVEGGKKRMGLMIAIDLDGYDWHRVRVPFRATEQTLTERLPARIKIRKNAVLESPHAIALIDNPEKNIIEPIYEKRNQLKKLYDFNLNMDGGNIKGYEVPNSKENIPVIEALLDRDVQIKKYGIDAGVMMVIGDGNHSVATAKQTWDMYKENLSNKEREAHPLRYMLIEMINIYSGVDFHPIHRIIYNPPSDFEDKFERAIKGNRTVKMLVGGNEKEVCAPENISMAIMEIQNFLENVMLEHPETEVDYIHNEAHLRDAIAEKGENTIGIIMPNYPAQELVDFVVNVGNLPKKAFSIGEPQHKRYYLEMRKITL